MPFVDNPVMDYKNMKFEKGYTPNLLPTPYIEGTPQDLPINYNGGEN